jgi:hypothetical protein
MKRKQIQSLISAGVFSAALLSGAVYADDNTPPNTPSSTAPSAPTAHPPAPTATTGADSPAPARSPLENSCARRVVASNSRLTPIGLILPSTY